MKRWFQRVRNSALRVVFLLKLVWRASPFLLVLLLLLSLLTGILPIITIAISAALLNVITAMLFGPHQGVTFWSPSIVPLCLALGGGLLLSQLLQQAQGAMQQLYQTKVTNFLQYTIAGKASSLDLPLFENPDFQNKMSLVSRDLSYRPVTLITQSTTAVSSLVNLISMCIVIAVWHLWIIPVLLCFSLLLFWVDTSFSRQKTKVVVERTPLARRSQYFYTLLTMDLFAKETRVFRLRDFFLAQQKKIVDGMYMQDQKLAVRHLRSAGFIQLLLIAVQTALNLYTIAQVFARSLSIGQYSFYVQSINQLNAAFLALMQSIAQLYENHLFLSYLFEFLALQPQIEAANDQQSTESTTTASTPCIEFRDVTFRYPDATTNAIEHLSFTLAPGQVMALVGTNGAGKTTLVKLLAGLYQPTEGKILLDGVDITTLSREALRALLAILFQDYPVYNLSATTNIGVGNLQHIQNTQRIQEAAQQSGFHQVVETLPEQYETILGRFIDRGYELSGGQRQLAGLARAFMRAAPVLILDEPTAALDPRNEWLLFERLLREQRLKNQSVIFISHRFSSVRHADYILVLEQGKKVEEGTHEELMQHQGIYAELFMLQAQMYEKALHSTQP